MRLIAAAVAVLALAPVGAQAAEPPVFEGPVPRADCGPGARPETGMQGEVTVEDRESKRSTAGYWCNLDLVGRYAGEGASWQDAFYRHCAYYDTKFGGGQEHEGTVVVDASDPSHPQLATSLTSIAMLDPWESLSVNEARGMLAGVAVDRYNSGVPGISGAFFFDVYDLTKDCTKPELLSSTPASGVNHEGEWAPDGMTYYAASIIPGAITAIDVSDAAAPRPLGAYLAAPSSHGLSVSDDGTRLYLATITGTDGGNGLTIFDTSEIQQRKSAPQIREVGSVRWDDGSTAQHTIPVTIGGKPFVIFVDEGTNGSTRLIDISDESKPRVVSKLRLEIQMPANSSQAGESASYGMGDGREGTFGYNAHYCGVPQRNEPGVVGCGYFESGVRIFDIRDAYHPREIAYYNVGGNETTPVPGSHRSGGTSAYSSSRVRFVADRREVWFTDQDKGFFVTRFREGVWPFKPAAAAAQLGLPPTRGCLKATTVRIRIRQPARLVRADVLVNGRRVKRLRGRALRRPVTVRLPKGHAVVRIAGRTRSGKRVIQTKDYTRCA